MKLTSPSPNQNILNNSIETHFKAIQMVFSIMKDACECVHTDACECVHAGNCECVHADALSVSTQIPVCPQSEITFVTFRRNPGWAWKNSALKSAWATQSVSKTKLGGQRDGWRVNRTCCSCKGPSFSFCHPHGGSQSSITLVPGNVMSSLAFLGTRHTHSTHTYMQAKHSENKTKKLKTKPPFSFC